LRGNLTDVKRHRAIKQKVSKAGGSWPILVEFERDAMQILTLHAATGRTRS